MVLRCNRVGENAAHKRFALVRDDGFSARWTIHPGGSFRALWNYASPCIAVWRQNVSHCFAVLFVLLRTSVSIIIVHSTSSRRLPWYHVHTYKTNVARWNDNVISRVFYRVFAEENQHVTRFGFSVNANFTTRSAVGSHARRRPFITTCLITPRRRLGVSHALVVWTYTPTVTTRTCGNYARRLQQVWNAIIVLVKVIARELDDFAKWPHSGNGETWRSRSPTRRLRHARTRAFGEEFSSARRRF